MMNENSKAVDEVQRMAELLSDGAATELRLLKQERKAEKRLAAALANLADDELRLEKARLRLERSGQAVAAAEADLRDAQARRAAGPERAQD